MPGGYPPGNVNLDWPPIDVSREDLRDAARLSLQSAIAAAALFVAMQAVGMPEKFVGVLSAVLVVQPTVGNTLAEAWDRVAATAVGSLIGVTALVALPGGYGTAVALAVSMAVMNAAAAFRPDWRYGVVAAVALSLRSDSDVFQTAQDRALAIALGAGVGVVTALVVWPDRASKRAHRHLRGALRAARTRLERAVERALGESEETASEARESFHSRLDAARSAAAGIWLGDEAAVRRRIDRTERLYNSILILHRVAEETDRALAEDDPLRERVETILECGCATLDALVEDDRDAARLQEIEDELDRIQDAGRPDDSEHWHALVFGLGEVRDSLRELLEAFDED